MNRILYSIMLAAALLVAAPSVGSAADPAHPTTTLAQAEHHVQPTDVLPDHGEEAAHAGEADHGPERALVPSPTDPTLWWEMLWTVVVFLIFFGVLSLVVWPKVLGALQTREQKQRDDLKAAEAAAAEATATLKQYQAQLAEARKEAQRMIEQSRADAQKVANEVREQAQHEAAQLRQRAQTEIAAAKEQAIADLYDHAAMLSTQVAGRILRREITPEDQRGLIEESLAKLSGNGKAAV